MIKNITITSLVIALIASIGWQFILHIHPSPPNKPEVHIFLPDDYCGDFVVFWGENTAAVDEPPGFLSYNLHPTHPNAVVINLPEPYERAGLRFIYQQTDRSMGRNPVFLLKTLGGVGIASGRRVEEDGSMRTWTLPDSSIDYDIFTIGTTSVCDAPSTLDRSAISDIYFHLSGTEFRWVWE